MSTHSYSSSENQKLLAHIPRYMAAVSLGCSLFIVVHVWRVESKRKRVFHRLMSAIAFNIIIMNTQQCWGTAAVPVGTPGVYGAHGSNATCAAQGIMLHTFGFAVPCYYFGLSIFSFCVVRSNFNGLKYRWIEKWIHIGAYIFPVFSSIYLACAQAFNFAGHTCWISSVPFGCGSHTDTVCTRGPQNIMVVQLLFALLPISLLLGLPLLSMVCLYVYVRVKQKELAIEAKSVAKQAGVYLAGLYWTYIFSIINSILMYMKGDVYFSLTLLASCWENLQGLWILLVYRYFGVESKSTWEISKRNHGSSHDSNDFRITNSVVRGVVRSNESETSNDKTDKSLHSARESSTTFAIPESNDSRDGNEMDEDDRNIYSNTIFDGTNASSHLRPFIFEGDSQDDEEDEMESRRWEGTIQC